MEQASAGVEPDGAGAPPGTRHLGGTHEPCARAHALLRSLPAPWRAHALTASIACVLLPLLSLSWAGLEEEDEDLVDFEGAEDGTFRWEDDEQVDDEAAEDAGGSDEVSGVCVGGGGQRAQAGCSCGCPPLRRPDMAGRPRG